MFNNKNTTVVLTGPQAEFLKPAGGGLGLTKGTLEKYNTIENMIEMVRQTKEKEYKLFIFPHYFYPHDHKWQFGGTGEHMVLERQILVRKSQYGPAEGGSGADFVGELRPYLDEDTIINSPHKIFGPEGNDLALQLRKNGVDTVTLGGMNGNLCNDSHICELIESGFNVVVATGAIGTPSQKIMDAALTNFGFITDQMMTTKEVLEQLS